MRLPPSSTAVKRCIDWLKRVLSLSKGAMQLTADYDEEYVLPKS